MCAGETGHVSDLLHMKCKQWMLDWIRFPPLCSWRNNFTRLLARECWIFGIIFFLSLPFRSPIWLHHPEFACIQSCLPAVIGSGWKWTCHKFKFRILLLPLQGAKYWIKPHLFHSHWVSLLLLVLCPLKMQVDLSKTLLYPLHQLHPPMQLQVSLSVC